MVNKMKRKKKMAVAYLKLPYYIILVALIMLKQFFKDKGYGRKLASIRKASHNMTRGGLAFIKDLKMNYREIKGSREHPRRRTICFILTIIMLFGMMPGLNSNAYADAITVNVNKLVDVDVVLTLGTTTQDVKTYAADLKGKLIEKGVPEDRINITTEQTSSFSSSGGDAKTIFDTWTNYPDSSGGWTYNDTTKAIGSTNNVQWTGYWNSSAEAQKTKDIVINYDFADTFVAANQTPMKTYTDASKYACHPDPQGFTFRMTKDATTGTYSYYVFWVYTYQQAAGLFKVTNVTNPNNAGNGMLAGYTSTSNPTVGSTVSNTTCLGFTDIDVDPTKPHHVKIEAIGNNIKAYYENSSTALFDVTDTSSPLLQGSYGPFTFSTPNAKLFNMGVGSSSTKTFNEAIRTQNWNDDSKRFIVNLDDANTTGLSDGDADLPEVLSRMDNDDINYIGWGNNTNKVQAIGVSGTSGFIAKNSGNGIFVNREAAGRTYSGDLDAMATYMYGIYSTTIVNNVSTLTYGMPYTLEITPSSAAINTVDATYPNGKWKIVHNPAVYENNEGTASYSGNYMNNLDVTFEKPGEYKIYYADSLIKTLYIHRKPVASFSIALDSSYNVSITDNSYDPDFSSVAGNGIVSSQWKWKKAVSDTWTSGAPTTFEAGNDYLVELKVQDNLGEWGTAYSRYCTSTTSSTTKPIADFSILRGVFYEDSTSNTAVLVNRSYDPAGKSLTNKWSVYKNGVLIYGPSATPKTDFSGLSAGDCKVTLQVENASNTLSESFSRIITINDVTPNFKTELKAISNQLAVVNGTVDYNGIIYNAPIEQKGIEYRTEAEAVYHKVYYTGASAGEFPVTLTGLSNSTKYYARSFSINSNGVLKFDSAEISFTTNSYASPTLTSNNTDVSSDSATMTGEILNLGSSGTLLEYGFVYSNTSNPSISNSKVALTGLTGVGVFSTEITGLDSNTTYYCKAYATDSGGTYYSFQSTFKTENQMPTTVTAWPVSTDITYGQALSSSPLTGGSAVYGTDSVEGVFSWTNSASIPTSVGVQNQSVTFTPTSEFFTTVQGNVSITVNKGVPTISLADYTTSYTGSQIPIGTTATLIGAGTGLATPGGAVTYTYYTDPSCTTLTTAGNSGALSNGAAPKDAGKYYVKATMAGDSSYNSVTTAAPATFTITETSPGSLSITGVPSTITYGDAGFNLGSTGGSGTGTVTYTSSNPSIAAITVNGFVTVNSAGSATITATKAGDGNYSGSTATAGLTIAKKPVTFGFSDLAKQYTGNAQYASITSSVASLNPGEDYTVTYTQGTTITPVAQGSYTVTVTMVNTNYAVSGTSSATFNITSANQLPLSVQNIPSHVIYGDSFTAGTIGGAEGGSVSYAITSGGSYATINSTTGAVAVIGVGSVTIQATKTSTNFATQTATATFIVSKKPISATATAVGRTYNGLNPVTISSFAFTGLLGSDGVTATGYSAQMTNPDAGNGKVVKVNNLSLTGGQSANYVLSSANIETTVDITPITIDELTVTSAGKTYDTTRIATITAAGSADILTGDKAGVVIQGDGLFASANVSTGAIGVTFTPTGLTGSKATNYVLQSGLIGTASGMISKAAVTFTSSSDTFVYDGNQQAAVISAIVDSTGANFATGNYTVKYNGSTSQPVNTGVYPVTVEVTNGNYSGTLSSTTLTIEKAENLNLGINGVPSGVIEYSDQFSISTFGGKGSGAVSYTGTNAYVNNSTGKVRVEDVGTVTLVAIKAADGNYQAQTATISFTAEKKTVSFGITNTVQNYNGSTKNVTVTPSVQDVTYQVTGNSSTEAGSYPITVSVGNGENKYRGSTSATLTINKLPSMTIITEQANPTYGTSFGYPTISVSTGQQTIPVVYGSNTGLGTISITYSGGNIVGEQASWPVQAGDYTVIARLIGDNNHENSMGTKTFTIGKKTLTVTPAAQSKRYGEANPAFTMGYSGFQYSDNENSLLMKPFASTAATAASPVGEYTVTGAGGFDTNYNFTYVGSTLTVNTAESNIPLYITGIPSGTISYGDTFTLYGNGGNGDGAYSFDIDTPATLTKINTNGNSAEFKVTSPGGIKVTLKKAADSHDNYDLQSIFAEMGAVKKSIGVTANAAGATRAYDTTKGLDETKVALTLASDKVNTSDVVAPGSGFTAELVTSEAGEGKSVQITGVTLTGTDAGKYELISSMIEGLVDITRASDTITMPAAKTKTYLDASFSAAATTTGQGTGTVSYTSSDISVATVAPDGQVTITGAGNATITATKAADTNYNGATASTPVTVNPKEVIFSIGGLSKQYNGNSQYASVTRDINGLTEGADFTVTYTKDGSVAVPVAAGDYAVAVAMVNTNYTADGTLSATLTISNSSQLPLAINDVPGTVTYGDEFTVGTIGGAEGGTVSYAITSGGSYASVNSTSGAISIVGVGTVTITATKSRENYSDEVATASFTTKKKAISVTATVTDRDYNGSNAFEINEFSFTGLLTGDHGKVAIADGYTAQMLTPDAGLSKVIRISGLSLTGTGIGNASGNYQLEDTTIETVVGVAKLADTITLGAISPKTYLTDSNFSLNLTDGNGTGLIVYTSSNTSVATVTPDGQVYILGAGNTTITATKAGDANYYGDSASTSLTVNPKPVSFTFNNLSKQYTGNALYAAVLPGISNLKEDVDYQVTYTQESVSKTPVSEGSYTVTVTMLNSNYQVTGTASATFTITNSNQLSLGITGIPATVSYGDSFTVNVIGGREGGSVVYGISGNGTIDANGLVLINGIGNITITATKSSINYNDEVVTATFGATKRQVTAVATGTDRIYNGSNEVSISGITVEGLLSADQGQATLDASLANSGQMMTPDVGNQKIVQVSGITLPGALAANYELESTTVETTVKISPIIIDSLTITASDKVYDTTRNATITVADSADILTGDKGAALIQGDGLFESPNASTEDQTVTYIPTGLSGSNALNYEIQDDLSATDSAKINKANVLFNSSNDTHVYDGNLHPAVISATVEGTGVPFQSEDYIVTYDGATDLPQEAGEYSVAVDVTNSNYSGSLPETTITIKSAEQLAFGINGIPNGQVQYKDTFTLTTFGGSGTGLVTYAVTEGNMFASVGESSGLVTVKGVGSVTIVATKAGDENYTEEKSHFTITTYKKKVNLTVLTTNKTYNGFAQDIRVLSDDNELDLDTLASTYIELDDEANTTAKDVGHYQAIVQVAASNPLFRSESFTGLMNISKATIDITADDKTKEYGASLPALTMSYGTFFGSDTKSALSMPTISCTANELSNVDTYSIVLTGPVSSRNYNVVLHNGTLTVTKKALTITGKDLSKEVSKPNPAGEASFSGFVNNEDASDLTGTLLYEFGNVIDGVLSETVGETYPIQLSGMNSGNYEINYENGTLSVLAASVPVAPPTGGGGGGGGGGSADPVPPVTPEVLIDIKVNDTSEDLGTGTNSQENNQTITTVTIEEEEFNKVYGNQEKGSTVTVSSPGSDVLAVVVSGQIISTMEQNQAVLIIKTGTATYSIPASDLNIDSVLAQFGSNVSLSDIKVTLKVGESTGSIASMVENAAGAKGMSIVVPPIDFSITCSYNGKTVTVNNFNAYVERTILIPDGVDPKSISTGVVYNPNGTFRHVPTTIVLIDGKYYAKINSMTNSVYTLVHNPVKFSDMENRWSKAAVNDMGARLVVSGMADGTYQPDREITRAEFAAILVKALGLTPGTGNTSFADVESYRWYNGYAQTAVSYGIISGITETTFGPEEKVTRQQAMAMIARAMKLTGIHPNLAAGEVESILSGYQDDWNISEYAKESIAACMKAGVVNGKTLDTIAPRDYINRGEVAAVIQKMLKKSGLI